MPEIISDWKKCWGAHWDRFWHCFANLNFDFFRGLMADLNKTYQSHMLLLTALVNCTMVADLIIEIKLWKPNPLNLLRGNVTQSLLLYFLQFLGADYMESFQPRPNFSPVNRAEIASRLHGQFEPGLSYINQGWKFQPGMKISTRDEMQPVLKFFPCNCKIHFILNL
jgi:hypothetical protein